MGLRLSSRRSVFQSPDRLVRVPKLRGYYSLKETPEAKTVPGVLIYQFSVNIVFFNADHFKARVLGAIAASDTSVEWVVVDASPINYVDFTAVQTIDELGAELQSCGIKLIMANEKRHLLRYFERGWVQQREESLSGHYFPTIKSAVKAFEDPKRQRTGSHPGHSEP